MVEVIRIEPGPNAEEELTKALASTQCNLNCTCPTCLEDYS